MTPQGYKHWATTTDNWQLHLSYGQITRKAKTSWKSTENVIGTVTYESTNVIDQICTDVYIHLYNFKCQSIIQYQKL